MSKLYNTLEKIRASEQKAAIGGNPGAPRGTSGNNALPAGSWRIVILSVSVALAIAMFLFFPGTGQKKSPSPKTGPEGISSEIAAPATSGQAMPPAAAPSAAAQPGPIHGGSYQQLNDAGLALIRDNQPWRGIYLLEQARKQQPERPEALINMAVTLAEMGLFTPAKRLLREAHALTPNHPLLRKNLELLARTGLIDRQWLFSLSAGETNRSKAGQ